MKQDLTKIYDGADLSGATSGVIYLPIVRASTLEKVSVRSDAAQSGDAVFEVRLNGGVVTGLAALTIPNGSKIGSVSGLNAALADGDEITLNLLSGSVSAPVTLNLGTDDGASSGGASFSFYDPDKPQISPSPFDDDFTGSILGGAWSQFGSADVTVTVADDLLQIEQPSKSDYLLSGVYRELPAGSFSIVAKVLPNLVSAAADSYAGAGFCLLENGADASKKILTAGFLAGGSIYKYGQVESWSSRTVFTATENAGTTISERDFRHWRYLRLDYNGSAYKLFSSRNGFDWGTGIAANPGFAPSGIGFFIYNYITGATLPLFIDWVRKYTVCPKYLGGGR